VDSLDFEPSAIYRSIERFLRRREDEREVNVLTDIGLRRTKVIIGRGREIHFLKPIEVGGQQLNEAVAHKLGISFEEARALRQRIAERVADVSTSDSVRQAVYDTTRMLLETLGREIGLCLRYYSVTFRGQRPSRVRLVGGEANDPQVESVLNSALSIPVEASKPLANVDTSRMKPHDRQGNLCDWARTQEDLGLFCCARWQAARCAWFTSDDGGDRGSQRRCCGNFVGVRASSRIDLSRRSVGQGGGGSCMSLNSSHPGIRACVAVSSC
jgi:hypothetical protein